MNLAASAERNGVARVNSWATAEQIPVDKVVADVGSALNGHRRTVLALVGDRAASRIVIECRDQLCRFGSDYAQAALAAQDCESLMLNSAEVDDGLIRDVTENWTSNCARLCGKRAAQNRAKRAITAAAADDGGPP
jgi:predicted site-specific integrase-resolvase